MGAQASEGRSRGRHVLEPHVPNALASAEVDVGNLHGVQSQHSIHELSTVELAQAEGMQH